MRGVFVTGTDTDVGKTRIATALARQLNSQGIRVVPRKPVESGCRKSDGELIPADALALQLAADYAGELPEVCAYRFEAALSPVRAARLSGKKITLAHLQRACTSEDKTSFMLVEGAGGFYSPLAEDGLNADLAEALQLPVLLVADDRLGCINQILLTTEAIEKRGLKLAAIVLNATMPQAPTGMDNAEDLRELIDTPVYSVAYDPHGEANLTDLCDRLLAR
ncbi:MAG: dethiobiotin synthase [Gammaproteobacteria bacterium]|jgi:dethiobiotin synthetase|nr:dethiobiotin synthase [Gammaproteobacteria bacterium]